MRWPGRRPPQYRLSDFLLWEGAYTELYQRGSGAISGVLTNRYLRTTTTEAGLRVHAPAC